MGTIRPRIQTSPGLAADRSANLADRQQIRRLLSTPPKPKAAPAPTGVVVGMAEVVSSSGAVFAAGNVEMSYGGVTYGAPRDPNDGGGGAATQAIGSWLTVDGYQLRLAAGWYIPVLTLRCLWEDPNAAPAAFSGPYMNGGWDSVHNDAPVHPRVTLSSGWGGIHQIANFGPTFMSEGTDLHAELRAASGAASADNDSANSRIVWNITKLG